MFLAIKEMQKERNKFLLIISIVLLISYLVFFLLGLAHGLAQSNKTAIDQWQSQAVLMSEESNGNLFASTVNYDTLLEYSDQNASPVNVSRTVAYKNSSHEAEDTLNIVFMGVDFTSRITPEIIAGELPANVNEVVISKNMVKEQNLKIGDTLLVSHSGSEYLIVGITDAAKLNTTPVVYVTLEMASPPMMVREELQADLFINAEHPPTTISAIVFQETPHKVMGEYNQLLLIDELIDALPGYTAQKLTFSLMIGFLMVISVMVLSIFMYIITIQKKGIYGIMKVQGISNRYIIQSVMLETFFVTIVGVGMGAILAIISGMIIPIRVPFEISPLLYSITAILMIVMSVLGATFSARQVAKIDPLEALR